MGAEGPFPPQLKRSMSEFDHLLLPRDAFMAYTWITLPLLTAFLTHNQRHLSVQNFDVPNAIVDVTRPAVTFMYMYMPATPSQRCRFSVETRVSSSYIEIFAVVG